MILKALSIAVLLVFITGAAQAQTTNAPAPAPVPKPAVVDVPQPPQPGQPGAAGTPDTAKLLEYQRRFAQGKELEQDGKLTEALAVFDGIIADSPDAKGSLREAGLITFNQGDLARADGYFEKLHLLVPDFTEALDYLIPINQTLKRDVKVAILIKEYRELYAAGKVTDPYFVRERIDFNPDLLLMYEFFDYTKDPYTVWMAEVSDPAGNVKRRLLLNYDPDATKALRAKDPRLAQAEVFALYEHVFKDGKVREIDVYKTYIGIPDYQKTRLDMLAILANTPKPIYSAPVPAQ